MRVNKYRIPTLLAGLIAVALIGLSMFVVIAWRLTLPQQSGAEAFLRDVTKLEIGQSTFEETKEIARRHGGVPWWENNDSMLCTWDDCAFRFVFENKPLTSTRLVAYVRLVGTLTVKNGVLVGRDIQYTRRPRKAELFTYNVTESSLPTSERAQRRGMTGLWRMIVDKKGIPSVISIYLQPSSGADQRRRAYALDLSCLSRIFGCQGPAAIFPSNIPYQGEAAQTHSETW